MVGRVGNTVTIDGKISAESPVRAGERVRGLASLMRSGKKPTFRVAPSRRVSGLALEDVPFQTSNCDIL
jgi:hypothetical protein